MTRSAFWSRAALGFVVLAAFDAVLLGYAWLHFAESKPEYFASEWPTFSRVLTLQTILYPWLAAIGGAGLFAGASALAAMQLDRVRAAPRGRGRGALLGMACAGLLAAPLGIVHFFHMSVTLSADVDTHMALSYTFFIGMTTVIAVYTGSSMHARRAGVADAAVTLRRLRVHEGVGLAAVAGALLFLATYILKDVPANPWPSATQKVFVIAEASWVVLTHVFALLCVTPVRAHFDAAARHKRATAGAYARSGVLVAALGALAASGLDTAHAAAPAGGAIGGTGRIQPAGGVIVVAAPPGRGVEQVLVKEGERVKKGALLVILADQPVRALERDLAAERVRNAERQAIERRRAAELEMQTAKLTQAQATTDLAAIKDLDERTFPAREKRQRENALAQAKVSLEGAGVKLEEAKKSADAELRIARTQLKLAEAALAASRITAPLDATVLEVHVQAGSSGGGPAVTLADTSRMYVVADFFEGDLPKLAAGQRVKVANSALGATLEGAIERIGRVIDPVNRLAKVWVRLDKPAPADRYIGMQVDVKVDSPQSASPTVKAAPRT